MKKAIDNAIIDETDAIEQYSSLANLLKMESENILKIVEDEKRHLQYFKRLREMI